MSPISEQLLLCGKKGSLLWEGNMPAQAQQCWANIHYTSTRDTILIWFLLYSIQCIVEAHFFSKNIWKFSRVIAKVAFISTWLHSVKLSTPAFFQNKRFLEKTQFYFCRSRRIWSECAKNPEIEINLLNLAVFRGFFDILLLLSRFNIILFPSYWLEHKSLYCWLLIS